MAEFRLHGPPGCGKSHALATRWVPKAAEKFGADNVVICSLTKTAASEIASRDLPIPKENVGTLHALAFRAMGRPTIAEGEVAEWNEREPMFRLGGGAPSVENPEVKKNEKATTGDDLMALAQVYRHNRTPRSQWRDDVASFQRRWDAWLHETGYMDFTGLIERAVDLPCAPGAPSVFVVDEAQDCSVVELDLVRRWSEQAEYAVLAGDGDQAIYGWRGASVKAFLGGEIPEENNYHLTQSYRVPHAVHKAASEWISRASYRYAVEYKPRDFGGEVTTSRGNAKNVEPLIDDIRADLDAGKSVMLLATCGYMLRNAIAVLRREGVPFANPFRPAHGGWNPLRGGAGKMRAYLRPDAQTYGERARVWTWREAAVWTEVLQSRGVLRPSAKTMIRQQAEMDERGDEVIGEADGRACFGESWDGLRAAFETGDPVDWLAERLLASKAKLMDYAINIAKKSGRAELAEDPRLCVGTVHSVKGGQSDVVYLLPDLSRSGMREWTRPGEGRDSIIRTFYVGMTRAKEKLVVCGRWSPASIDWRPSTT
ncbi:MAG: UvrD-helicase domain-containing protein [Longimicrobiales bacterium]|nr:UvrD-helicase domain-containing protein [Longimicrobiales bacterium]